MGCDIHTIVEIVKDGKWEAIEDLPKEFDERNYILFSFLANVRNHFNTKGFTPKGFPIDLSDKVREMEEKWGDDLHSKSYLSLQELDDADKEDFYKAKCKICKSFYDKFIQLGGTLPKGMDVETVKIGGFIDAIRESFEPNVIVSWSDGLRKSDNSLYKGIENLKNIALKYNISDYNNIRIVFGFDN